MTDMGGRNQFSGLTPRDRYLERVAVRLRMPDGVTGAVLDELATHIDDAISAGIERGLTPEEAEHEAIARLGSADDLGDELRRTHQTRRRLLAAVGGGAWQATQGAVRGYLGGLIVSYPLLIGGAVVLTVVAGILRISTSHSVSLVLFQVLIYPSIWGAAWLSARYLVEGVSDRSMRSVESLRARIAWIGAGLVAIPVAILPADHTTITVVLAIATPLVFAIGALTTGRHLGERIRPRAWTSRMPQIKRAVYVTYFVVVIGSAIGSAVVAGLSEPTFDGPDRVVDESTSPPPAQQRWKSAGFDVVAPTVVDLDGIYLGESYPRDGFVVVGVPDDRIDWDEWEGLRFEVWAATSPLDGGGRQTVLGTEPLAVVPIPDPWARDEIAVRVGYPGADGSLLFLIAQDPVTGKRVAFGEPGGDVSRFHGSLLEWFTLR